MKKYLISLGILYFFGLLFGAFYIAYPFLWLALLILYLAVVVYCIRYYCCRFDCVVIGTDLILYFGVFAKILYRKSIPLEKISAAGRGKKMRALIGKRGYLDLCGSVRGTLKTGIYVIYGKNKLIKIEPDGALEEYLSQRLSGRFYKN